ncbi:insulin-like growth factor-binding protein-related protein 1 [Melanaphis sacchari]|nr:insulin-like growth factor-binding protein-related protein 1 [Melanaphis sacchari]
MAGCRRVSQSLFHFCHAFALAVALAVTGSGGDDVGGGQDAVDVPPLCPGDGCAAIRCPVRDRDICPLGLVPDACACCPNGLCGLGETAPCNAADRPCAENLECVKTEDVNAGVQYRCACKETDPICGSDNRTYSNACQLNEAAAELGNNGTQLWMRYRGPCQSAPVIRSAPKNLAGSIGHTVVFDCEVKGYPVPSINWQFTNTYGITKWLPGDDTLIAIQTRGGPDHFTVTSWVQIMEFKPAVHTGNYTCLGTNSVDITTASAVLDVRKMV